ncbi:hypothetical protein CVT24_005260 [Panaeolus cyanescens]|uniref:S-methyl-5-thioribose-1-phosphate isomerase n=1 Tax=Panaeolus cyanescens TaxID=181874 RepID=A0A409Y9C4_9AGAR|nr:hypothetical protein CVT24_005260 [Panaeolus cyanescens]
MSLISIKSSEDSLEIVNQLLLPHSTQFIPIESIQDAHDAIKSMKIRGAPAIASLAALSVAQLLTRALETTPSPDFLASPSKFSQYIQETLDFLYTARPTAVNLGEATSRLSACMKNAFLNTQDPTVVAQELIKAAKAVADEDVGRNKEMAKHAGEWLIERVRAQRGDQVVRKGLNVLTVCNTGSLATSHYDIHAVVVGADRIAKNGDTANKPRSTMFIQSFLSSFAPQKHFGLIGTYNASVIAARHNIPVIVVAPVTTVDLATENGSQIPIEQRPPIEACLVRGIPYPPTDAASNSDTAHAPEQVQVMITPPGLQGIYNPSFDVTPAELITAIVTEKGVAVKKDGENVFDLVGAGVV